MSNTLKAATAIFIIAAALIVSTSYCENGPDQPKTNQYEGRIAYIDWVASKVILRGVGQKEFYVPSGTKIRKLGGFIAFSDLNLLDNAAISYYEDSFGKNVAIRITITVV